VADHAAPFAAKCDCAAGGPGIARDGQRHSGGGGAVISWTGHSTAGGVLGVDAELRGAVPARLQLPFDLPRHGDLHYRPSLQSPGGWLARRAGPEDACMSADLPDNRLLTVFAPFPRFELAPPRTALIVVDMQYVDAHPDAGIGRAAKEAGNA